jgi:predicted MFS family arabinose efflux permease
MTAARTATPRHPDAIPPAVVGLSFVSLWNDVASEMVYPLLPNFIVRTLGGGPAMLGVLDGAAELTGAAVKWVSGRLSDRPGLRGPLILGGYATAVFVRPLSAIASAAGQVVGFRVIDRVGKGLRTAPRDAMIADVTPLHMRGRAFGFHRALDHLGAVLGSIAAWALLAHGVGVRQVIGWSVVPGILALLTLAIVLRMRKGTGPVAAPTAHPASPVQEQPRTFWPAVLALSLLALARLPEALLLLRVQDLGVAAATIPLLWGGLHVVRSAGSYPGGWLSDHLGPRVAVAAGGVLFAAVVGLLSRNLHAVGAAGVFLLLGGVAGLTEPAERALVAKLSPKRLGSGFGAFNAITGLAALPAAALFGLGYQHLGGSKALVASGMLTVLAVGWWLVVIGKENVDR